MDVQEELATMFARLDNNLESRESQLQVLQ